MALDYLIGRKIRYNRTGETGHIKGVQGTMITMVCPSGLEINGLYEDDITFIRDGKDKKSEHLSQL